ncbi:MAG: DUF72 domain-containing protein, partial [Gemmatimonadales bacterium]
NYPGWVGPFYPPGTRPPEFLRIYSRAFKTVEIDSTFYGVPADEAISAWAERVPAGFAFALKIPREITHERRLRNAGDELRAFVDRAYLLGDRLGPLLVQCPPDFGPQEEPSLAGFLAELPSGPRFAVEFRHGGWVTRETLALLERHRVALVLTDGPWVRKMLDLAIHPTTDFAYVRWAGRRRRQYSPADVDQQLSQWSVALAALASRVKTVYGYFSNSFAGHAPESARAMQGLIGQKPVEADQLGPQTSLF